MQEFLKEMLSDGQDVSSKRACGTLTLVFFLLVVFMAVWYLIVKGILENYLLIIFGSLMATFCTFFGLTLTEMPWVK
jgi:hypothetical protein